MNQPLPPIGFWSYTKLDDEASGGKLTALRQLLANDLQTQFGRTPVRVFEDKTTIPMGSGWEAEIRRAIDEANFFIPVITPGFLQSEWCCREVTWFREREKALGREDLIFPLLYVAVDDLRPEECFDPEVRSFLLSRQAVNFSLLRLEDPGSREVVHRLAELAGWVRAALRRTVRPVAPPKPAVVPVPRPAPDRGDMGKRVGVGLAAALLLGAAGYGAYEWNRPRIVPAVIVAAKPPPAPAPPVPRQPVPGPDTIERDCATCPEMVLVPAGAFTMGVTEEESLREANDKDFNKDARPLTPMKIASPFWIGRYPVTVGQWKMFAEDPKYTGGDEWKKPPFQQTDNHPVVNVSAKDAEDYAAWLSAKTGKTGPDAYRLPSEAEWEYAARAGTTTARYWGDGFADAADYAWSGKPWPTGTAPVIPSRKPNKFGLYDMLGNVWQWTADNYHPDYTKRPQDASVWPGGDSGRCVLRGGSWSSNPRSVRAGVRINGGRGIRGNDAGFRLSRTLSAPKS